MEAEERFLVFTGGKSIVIVFGILYKLIYKTGILGIKVCGEASVLISNSKVVLAGRIWGLTYVFVAAPSFRRTLASDLSTEGGVLSRSAAEMPPLSSRISATTF